MLLDRYNPNDHDLYTYENDPTDASTWNVNYSGVFSGPPITPDVNFLKNIPTGYNPNCLLAAYEEDSPPFHKISVSPRRALHNSRDYIIQNSVKDRFINSISPNWRISPTDNSILSDSNTWNSGFPQYVALGNKILLCSRESIENMNIYDLEYNINRNVAMNFGSSFFLPEAVFFRSQTNDINNIQPLVFSIDNGIPDTQSTKLGGDAPPLKDLVYIKTYTALVSLQSNPSQEDSFTYTFDHHDEYFDTSKMPSDLLMLTIQSENSIPDDLKINLVITEEQLKNNLYYDGINFYSPILYGLDSNGKVFRIRKKYYGSDSSDISDISSEGLSYFSEVDDVFGKPIGLWEGDYSSPMFVKTEQGWAFYSMGFCQSGLTDKFIQWANSKIAGCNLQKVDDDKIISTDYLISNSTNDYSSSSITVPRSIGSKIGVEVRATNTETGEEFNQTLISNSIIIENPADLPDEADRIPPYLIDDRIELLLFEENIEESRYPTDEGEGAFYPPYLERGNTELKPIDKYLALTPYMLKYSINESESNIQNPSGKPYTSEVRYYLVWDYYEYEITLTALSGVLQTMKSTGSQLRKWTSTTGTTSTIRLNPVIGRILSKQNPDTLKYRVGFDKLVEDIPLDVSDALEIGNIYINPTGGGAGQISNNIEFIGERRLESLIPFSGIKHKLSMWSDPNMYSVAKMNWGGARLRVEYSLVNEYGKTTYKKTTNAPFDYLHAQNLQDELLSKAHIRLDPNILGNPSDPPPLAVIPADKWLTLTFDYRTRTWVGWPPAYVKVKFIFDGNDDLFFCNNGGPEINNPCGVFEKQASPINASDSINYSIRFKSPPAGTGFDGKILTALDIEWAYTSSPAEGQTKSFRLENPVGFCLDEDGDQEGPCGTLSFEA